MQKSRFRLNRNNLPFLNVPSTNSSHYLISSGYYLINSGYYLISRGYYLINSTFFVYKVIEYLYKQHPILSYVPASKWTMEKKGTKKIEIGGLNDKCQITGLFAATMSGDFLPIQLVYQDKMKRSHPDYPFPSDWHITHTHPPTGLMRRQCWNTLTRLLSPM